MHVLTAYTKKFKLILKKEWESKVYGNILRFGDHGFSGTAVLLF